ncbi:MAG: family 20 glycosylhydrolase [Opitutaceae bacterium]
MKTEVSKSLTDTLFPVPRTIRMTAGAHRFPDGRIVARDISRPGILRSARRVQEALTSIGVFRELAAHPGQGQKPVVELRVDATVARPQGYRIRITKTAISLIGNDEAGLSHATTTFAQLIDGLGAPANLPCLTLTDWPDFERRGIMLDVSRDKVPTMETLLLLIDRMAGWKLNEFQLYTEHTFAYANHRTVWEKASPFTPDEILQIDAYCRDRGIELVPNQNAFGHFERWLKHEAYAHLSECPEPTDIIAWGHPRTVSRVSLCPIDPGSLQLIDELLRELLPHFSSPIVNVGCDETIDLGYGRSESRCRKIGEGRVYLDYILGLRETAARQGRTIQFWGDIIVNHPELIPEIPKDVTALVWGYEQNHPFDRECAAFKASGLQFYVCPGTSSWTTLTGRRENAVKNLESAARNGAEHGARGYLITDWGDHGHWQPLGLSYPYFAYGAALSWSANANRGVDLARVVNQTVYGDRTGRTGRALLELGLAPSLTGISPHNCTVFFQLLQAVDTPLSEHSTLKALRSGELEAARKAITGARDLLDEAKPTSRDGKRALGEIRLIIDLALHACRQGRYRLETPTGSIAEVPAKRRKTLRRELTALIRRHRRTWIKSNRPGGLEQSAERLENILAVYSRNL